MTIYFASPDHTFCNALISRSPDYSPSQACVRKYLLQKCFQWLLDMEGTKYNC